MWRLEIFLATTLFLLSWPQIALSGILTMPSSASDTYDLDFNFENSTVSAGGHIYIRDFSVEPRSWGQKIRPEACLVNAIQLAGEISLENVEGRITKPTLYRFDNYPDVFFAIVPQPGANFKRKHLIMGLSKGIYYMMHFNKFQVVTFDLEEGKNVVGYIYFKYQAPATPTSSLALPEATQSGHTRTETASLTNDTSDISTTPIGTDQLSASKLEVRMRMDGESIVLRDIVMILFVALFQAATQLAGHIVNLPWGVFCEYPAVIQFKNPEPPRKQPPFLQVQTIIKSVVRVLPFMFSERKFGEMSMIVDIGGVTVATGKLLRSGGAGPSNMTLS